MVSCQEIKDCELQTRTDYAIVGFYQLVEGEKELDTLAFDLITEKNAGLYYLTSIADTVSDDTLSVIGLPLNPADTVVTYVFETDSVNYELTMVYTPHLRIYYEECDPVYSYKLDTVYSSEFDSVAIYNRVMDKVVTSNVEVYL